jgi:hypothetical protein
MTTVIDPAGTPIPVFNKNGATIVSVTPNGTVRSGATEIPNLSGLTIALVDPDASNTAVKLPSNGDIGDVIEVYCLSDSHDVKIYSPDSQYIGAGASAVNGDAFTGGFKAAVFRRIAADRWAIIRSGN